MRSPVSVTLDKRRKSTTGENKNKYPIKIKVNFKQREGKVNKYIVRRYPTGVFCKEGEFSRKKNQSEVVLALSKAMELYKKNLSITEFERMYSGSGGLEDIKSTFDYAIKKLEDEGRDGTAISYKNALSSLTAYGGEFISFESIIVEWLEGYEKWMRKPRVVITGKRKPRKKTIPERSFATIGMYLRALRRVFKIAIRMKIISADLLPFGVGLYVIPTGRRKTKKAFTREEKNLILSYRSEREDINQALDFWGYQYFSDGCNMADVAYLKNRNIDGEFLAFDRKKTENTERDRQAIDVHVNDRMREVIRRHGNKSLDPDAYVFPILNSGMTSRQRKEAIRQFIKITNELLAEAQKEINKNSVRLSIKLTTGTARYTAATLLKRHGIDLATIAKTLGHGSEATTERYTEEERETQIMISKALSS